MIVSDLHVHTIFSDGKNTPEEMVQAAIDLGMTKIGFSDHAHTHFDERYCIQINRLEEYRQTIRALRDQYAGRIEILCGIEQDFYSDTPADEYDYVIGSAHYVKKGDVYIPVDEKPEILIDAVEQYYDGDFFGLIEDYFSMISLVQEKTNADVIGHFDLITKFNEGGKLFDERNPRYRSAAYSAADTLLKCGKPFEINTGAISRGYRTQPYPSAEVLEYLRKNGARFILSSDSHAVNTLCFRFDDFEQLL